MECDVCCEVVKKEVVCNLCDYKACYKCFSKFILECTVNPKCMKCNKPWSRKSLVEGFGQYFVSHKYKQKREDVLFDLEKALLPETQPHVVRILQLRELSKQEEEIRTEIEKQYQVIRNLDKDDFETFLKVRKDLKMVVHSMYEDIENIHIRRSKILNKKEHTVKTSQFVVKCPKNECKGYIGSSMTCELCSTRLCKNCHGSLNGEEHTCKEDDVNTLKLLKTNTKNCPSCKTLIYRVDGCDQMYCTYCHNAFSWRTGEVVFGRIHNPHYYEYLRMRGLQEREVGDIPCGGIPRVNEITKKYGYQSRVLDILRICTHIEYVEVPFYTTNIIENNRDLRISYMLGDMTIDVFKHTLQKREKAMNKKREISTILNTFLVVASDILQRCVTTDTPEQSVLTEFESIRNYTNNLMRDVSRVYTCVTPIISEYWDIMREKSQVLPLQKKNNTIDM